ncbi:hypothetical protein Pint_36580 [Pistacia integerrima]|uniref:Uncharacterized protein n=1 Tax=Pistacia integerrima TaxID=434235 RepID=A0ACC0Y0Y9_9ROSI|nr:hypothetical protein Pint_36580 [Pistacia integerrima]
MKQRLKSIGERGGHGITKNGEMSLAMKFFEEMEERNMVSWNLMLDEFVEVDDLDSAWKFFQKIPNPNFVSWVTMICGYARSGNILEARRLFDKMPSRNVVSWNAMIASYVQSFRIDETAKLFMEMPRRDPVSWTTMIDGYVLVGKIDKAGECLDQMPYNNIAAQTAVISGYVHSKRMDEASQIFKKIGTHDVVCWNSMIAGYARCGKMDEALNLFKQMVNKDIVTWNTMIAGHAQIGHMDNALKIFKGMGNRNIVSWNSLIAGFLQNGLFLDALKSFALMGRELKKPDHSAFACGLKFPNTELVFKDIGQVDVVSWNSLIAGYAFNGCGKEAIKLLEEMVMEGVAADQGLKLFKCMTEVYGMEPLFELYACLVDLLGRTGRLHEAFDMVRGMKMKPNAGIWGTLLGACRTHQNLELGRWDEVEKVRGLMKGNETEKQPGYSWIEIRNQILTFLSLMIQHTLELKKFAVHRRL